MAASDIDFLIMGIIFILAITFMLLSVLREKEPKLTEAAITSILWFVIALYFPTFQPAVPGISWLFYGLGLIFTIITGKAAFDLFNSRRERSVEL